MDDLITGLLWFLIIAGALAWLWLFAEGVEWCADQFDAWQSGVFHDYQDDL